jgi:hypothetical protein
MFNGITCTSRVLRLNWYSNDDKMLRSRWTVENAMLGAPHKPFGLCGFYSCPDDVDDPNLACVPYGPSLGLRGSLGQRKL